jgi:hypothetical protein
MLFTTSFFFGVVAGLGVVEFNKKIGFKFNQCWCIFCPIFLAIYIVELGIAVGLASACALIIVGITIIPAYIV